MTDEGWHGERRARKGVVKQGTTRMVKGKDSHYRQKPRRTKGGIWGEGVGVVRRDASEEVRVSEQGETRNWFSEELGLTRDGIET